MSNPRYSNGHRRREIRKWLMATQDVCALCGKPIDKTLKTPHPMSFEVDEIVPVSRGGDPLDRGNVQASHRECNRRKSNLRQGRKPSSKTLPIPRSREW